ncbi:MAG: hypothetical protein R3174_07265 [Gammaproteobacteria bacterium]|nr:hypothetical protein [Gammaproteobacteria bacterium]
MSLIRQAVESIGAFGPGRERDRARALDLFHQVLERMERALEIWQAFRDSAPETGDRFTAVLWMGAEPARELHALYLENKTAAGSLTELTGVRFKDSLNLAEDLDIVQPYEQLGPKESGRDRAEKAIRIQTERTEKLKAALAALDR